MPGERLRLLFVDDDPVTRNLMQRHCARTEYDCTVFGSASEALQAFRAAGADMIVTDLRMPQMSGFELLNAIRAIDSEVPVLVMTGYSSVENAVEAMKRGATDFIKKPFDFQELRLMIERTRESLWLRRENRRLRRQIGEDKSQFGLIGQAPAMTKLFETITKVASVSCNVIIGGESGTGKELVARALHDYGPRREQPFVVIDCGALTESLLESELFGHERGAFTGAGQRKQGLMEHANGGTLFLDEIGNISDAMQVKLMRAIEDQRITPVGSTRPVPVDLRVIAATNRDLGAMVEAGEFRHDFYHRLNVVNLRVPALAERRTDIPLLVGRFVAEFGQRYGRTVDGFDAASMQRLCEAPWPGNIRELRNAVERCVILAESPVLHWPCDQDDAHHESRHPALVFPERDLLSLEQVELEYIKHVLRSAGGKKTKAARILNIDKTTLWRKLRRLP